MGRPIHSMKGGFVQYEKPAVERPSRYRVSFLEEPTQRWWRRHELDRNQPTIDLTEGPTGPSVSRPPRSARWTARILEIPEHLHSRPVRLPMRL